MKILFQRPAPDHFGGGILLVDKIRERLTALGVEVDFTHELEPDLAGYDLVHLFYSPKLSDLFTQCANAQRQSRPLMFMALAWDYPRQMAALKAVGELPLIARLEFMFGDQLYGALMGEADLVVTNSAMEGGWLTRDYGVSAEKQRVIPLAAESSFATAEAEPFVERFGVRDFVLCSAVLARSKNQLRLIRALQGFHAPLVLAYPHAEPDYERRCREEADDNVIFAGNLEQRELAHAYAAAKVHALVSFYETVGMATIEAGLAGCNLVCTAHSPISEYVGNHAWYADPLDAASIRRAVELAYRVPRSYILRNEILANFNWERAARLTQTACNDLLEARHSLIYRKGEARYRWLMSFRENVERLRAETIEAVAAAQAASAQSPSAAAQAHIEALSYTIQERDAQLGAISNSWGYRLHHRLATSLPARVLRWLRNPGPPPKFEAPRGPALDALAGRAEVKRVLVIAQASAWHVRRALQDLRRALPETDIVLAAAEHSLAQVRTEPDDIHVLPLTRSGYSELSGLHDAVIVVGEVGARAVRLAERTGARLLVQYNATGYFAGAAVITTPADWKRSLRRAAVRQPATRALTWFVSRAYADYFRLWERLRPKRRMHLKCIQCGARGPASVLWATPDGSPYVRCRGCSLVQLADPPPPAALTDIYEDEPSLQLYLDTRTDSVTRFRHERILNHIERWRQPGRVLDIGCADGRFLEVARDPGWHIEGIETSPRRARKAEQVVGRAVHTATLEQAAFPDEHFDAVNMSHLIEHVTDPRALLAEARRILKPGGVLAISTPNVAGLSALVQRGRWHQAVPEYHVALFSMRTLTSLLRSCGLAVVEAQTVSLGRILGELLWTSCFLRRLPTAMRRIAERREPQLNEYLAQVGMGEELLVVARKPV